MISNIRSMFSLICTARNFIFVKFSLNYTPWNVIFVKFQTSKHLKAYKTFSATFNLVMGFSVSSLLLNFEVMLILSSCKWFQIVILCKVIVSNSTIFVKCKTISTLNWMNLNVFSDDFALMQKSDYEALFVEIKMN